MSWSAWGDEEVCAPPQQVGASGAIDHVEVRGSGSGYWEGMTNTWGREPLLSKFGSMC
jgi:hypothetical protein